MQMAYGDHIFVYDVCEQVFEPSKINNIMERSKTIVWWRAVVNPLLDRGGHYMTASLFV